MVRPQQEQEQAGGAPTGGTTTASPTDDVERQGNTAQAASWTESPENTSPQPPSTTTGAANNAHTTTRQKQHKYTAERPGKLHTRVPSYRGKQHHNAPPKLISRKSYHHPEESHTATTARQAHRRAHSDVKLAPGDVLPADIKRNRSHQDIAKRNRSFDKPRAQAAGTKSRSHAGSPTDRPIPSALAGSRTGGEDDGDDDEWVDDSANASTNASPYPRTLREPQKHPRVAALSPIDSGKTPTTPSGERDISQHKEYLTSRLLHRASSHGAPPQVSSTMASAPRSHRNSPDTTISQDSTAPATPNAVSGGEEDEGLTSRFLTRPGSTFAREGSFFTNGSPAIAGRSLDDPGLRRPRSMTELNRDELGHRRDVSTGEKSERGNRRRGLPAEISRTQQKLNLQRASSVMEPQPLNPAPSMMGSAATLVGIPASGYDGTPARDPRLPRLLEKAGMEYRVVRRYQNPIFRSMSRLEKLPGWDAAPRETSRGGHARNSSLPPLRNDGVRPATPMRAQSSRGNVRNGLVGGEALPGRDGNAAVAAALRNLWEKPLDLSASQ